MNPKSTARLWRILQAAGIEFVIVGSVASSVVGEARTTQDVDLLAVIQADHLPQLSAALAGEFYFDELTAREALAARRAFNIIALEGLLKFDLFPAADSFARSQLRRRQWRSVPFLSPELLPVASAEDTILAKLRWYDEGGRSSDRQWRDIEGIVRVQGSALDVAYLQEWANALGVADLLRELEIS